MIARRLIGLGLVAPMLAGCEGRQSALDPRGEAAARIAELTWVLFAGGAAILLLIVALVTLAIYGAPRWRQLLTTDRVILGGGFVFPAVTLGALLVYGLAVLKAGAPAAADEAAMRITVVGHQWWWRVIYEAPDGSTFESANEIRIPVGRTVAITLRSDDVIHSFWVPALAGKLDMIPGRENVLHLSAAEAGIVRGQCAEYCGGAHALMAFHVVALEAAEHAGWLAAERQDARAPVTASEQAGARAFVAAGCGGCHAVRGTAATGRIAPDLTHAGSRRTIAAGVLPAEEAGFAAWIRAHPTLKPGTHMPRYDVLSDREVADIATYLASLR